MMSQCQFSILFDQQFLVKHKIVQVQHSLYSPDLVLCNFFLFSNLKIHLKRFEDMKDIKKYHNPPSFNILKKRIFRGASTNRSLPGISVLECQEGLF